MGHRVAVYETSELLLYMFTPIVHLLRFILCTELVANVSMTL